MKTKELLFSALLCLLLLNLYSCQKESLQNRTASSPDLPQESYDYSFNTLPINFRFLTLNFDVKDSLGALTNEKATLGRVLFYDKKLSLNSSISCGSCHQQDKAFSDGKAFSQGLNFETTSRNSMSLGNTGFQRNLFWDGSATDLRKQVLMPIHNHIEMGIEKAEDLVHKLETVDYYAALFEKAYGDNEITEEKISIALAQFLAAMTSVDSKYDKGNESDFQNFNLSEKLGKELFFEKFNCDNCHNNVLFANSWLKTNVGLDAHIEAEDILAFKIPSLRNIELTAPYMHDGRFSTLEEVVEHYNSGIQLSPGLSWSLREGGGSPKRFNMTADEKSDLIAFLKTLTDESFVADVRFSNPF